MFIETDVVDPVASGIDLAIRVGHLEDSSLVARKLMSSPSMVRAIPTYFSK